MFTRLDTFVQYQFQEFSNYSQYRWGKNCYWWAYIWTHISGAWSLFVAYYIYKEIISSGEPSILRIAIISVATVLAILKSMQLPELKRMSQSNEPQLKQSHGYDTPPLLDLCIGIVAIFMLDPLFGLAFTWAMITYFKNCIPLPPDAYVNKLLQPVIA